MKILFTLLLTCFYLFATAQGCSITTSNITEISGDDGSGNCTYSIDILFTEGTGPDNGTLTFSSTNSSILTGAGPHSCACTGNTYTLTFQATCGSSVAFTAFHDNSGIGNDCTITAIDIALAVEWLDFNVKVNDRHSVELFWSTASEVNNEAFEIEFSKDGRSFEYLVTIPGSGTSSVKNDYFYSYKSEFNGILYYRIKQIDFDGNFSYSELRHVSFVENLTFSIFPNPARETLFITSQENTIKLYVIDSTGKIILSSTDKVIDLRELKNGLYTLMIQTSNAIQSHQFFKSN